MQNQPEFKILREGSADAILEAVPDTAGVYALLVRNGKRLVEALGYSQICGLQIPEERDGFAWLYLGASGDMRLRVKKHLLGDVRTSTFRKTMLAAEQFAGALSASGAPLPPGGNTEFALTDWLVANARVAVRPCHEHEVQERALLATLASPLNIEHRRATLFARRLMRLRALFDERNVPSNCRAA